MIYPCPPNTNQFLRLGSSGCHREKPGQCSLEAMMLSLEARHKGKEQLEDYIYGPGVTYLSVDEF